MNISRTRNQCSDTAYSPHSIEENEEHISEDVLEQVLNTLKHNSESTFLLRGKTMELPNNLFNSEDMVVTMKKHQQELHRGTKTNCQRFKPKTNKPITKLEFKKRVDPRPDLKERKGRPKSRFMAHK